MKKYFVLLLLIFTTQLFAQEKPEVSSVETTYILEGKIEGKDPITMYLTTLLDVKNNTKKVSGENILENKANITVGNFKGQFSDDLVFKGTWSSEDGSFDFELKPNPNSIVQVIELKKYSFTKNLDINFHDHEFEFFFEVFQIANPKKLSSINKHLATPPTFFDKDFDTLYSKWMENVEKGQNLYREREVYDSGYKFTYVDNNILSLEYDEWTYTGGSRGYGHYKHVIYSLSSGEIIGEGVEDLISNVDDDKLVTLMRQKLIDHMQKSNYPTFEYIRLSDNYSVGASGVTFTYNSEVIAYYHHGIISIHFTYDELKPFVKKSSPLWYLFE